jgi:hypothetical protein
MRKASSCAPNTCGPEGTRFQVDAQRLSGHVSSATRTLLWLASRSVVLFVACLATCELSTRTLHLVIVMGWLLARSQAAPRCTLRECHSVSWGIARRASPAASAAGARRRTRACRGMRRVRCCLRTTLCHPSSAARNILVGGVLFWALCLAGLRSSAGGCAAAHNYYAVCGVVCTWGVGGVAQAMRMRSWKKTCGCTKTTDGFVARQRCAAAVAPSR